VLAEHGHQIGNDVNRFENWPTVTTASARGQRLMIRPWGERFVQKLFNAEEAQYPIIDNLNPESAGARYRMADRGFSGTAADVARFLTFNVFETSLDQKMQALEVPGEPGVPPAFDRATAIAAAPALLLGSLPANDPFRQRLEKDDDEAKAIRKELADLAASMSDEELKMLCQNVILADKRNLCAPALGALVESKLIPRQAVFAKHIAERVSHQGSFDVFIYAHTHRWERAWKVPLPGRADVTVLNTGAFQRLVDEEGFLQRAKARNMTPVQALNQLRPEDLAPCYGVIVVTPRANGIETELRMWHAPEDAAGRFRSPGVADCR
jgi:hypothetical protein